MSKPMSKRAAKALEKCILHWEENVELARTAPGQVCTASHECALCNLYNAANCRSCPVALATGAPYCRCTPYKDVLDADYGARSNRKALAAACKRELEFLKSLRDPEDGKE